MTSTFIITPTGKKPYELEVKKIVLILPRNQGTKELDPSELTFGFSVVYGKGGQRIFIYNTSNKPQVKVAIDEIAILDSKDLTLYLMHTLVAVPALPI